MPFLSYEILTGGASAVAAAAAGVAAFFKFRAWWHDRQRQARIESATYLKDKGDSPEDRAQGRAELLRIHFATLTGIDKVDGHAAIRRLHARLGGTDLARSRIKDVGSYLVTSQPVATVRKPRGRDHWVAGASLLTAAATAFFSVGCIVLVMVSLEKLSESPSGLKAVFSLASLLGYFYLVSLAAMLAVGSHFTAKWAGHHMNAMTLRRTLRDIARFERKARLNGKRRRASPAILQLVEMEPPINPTPKPYLVASNEK